MTTKKPGRSGIEIHRNIIEQSLMTVQKHMKERRNLVLGSAAGLLAVTLLVIGAMVYVNMTVEKQRLELERITGSMELQIRSTDSQAVTKIIGDLRGIIDGYWFGTPRVQAYLVLGNLYYHEKKFKESKECLEIYARKTSNPLLSAMALLKAAAAVEEMNDLDGALKIYDTLEKKYADSAAADMIYYNQARVYAKKKDLFNARKYYNRVIASFPQSVLADRARKSIFLLGAQ